MGCHIASHRVTCDSCDAVPQPSRHVTPPYKGVTDVTVTRTAEGERGQETFTGKPMQHTNQRGEKNGCRDD
jgi:hypothetical protein